jgi:hypothetical protein
MSIQPLLHEGREVGRTPARREYRRRLNGPAAAMIVTDSL